MVNQAGDGGGGGGVGTINKSEITVTTCVSNVPVLTPIFIFYMDFLGTRDTSTMYHIHQSNLHHQLHWMDGYMARKVVDQTMVYTNARSEFILLNS